MNIFSISLTIETLNDVKSRLLMLLQLLNIEFIVVTFAVLKLLIIKLVIEEQL